MNLTPIYDKYSPQDIRGYSVTDKDVYIGKITLPRIGDWNKELSVRDENDGYVGRASSIIEAKLLLRKRLAENASASDNDTSCSEASFPVYALPASESSEFYPTPSELAGKMLGMVNWKKVRNMLEPSAGKGDLVVFARKAHKSVNWRSGDSFEVDCIEQDPNLQAMLIGANQRLVHDDFLSFDSAKQYDLIVMNPPFSNGAEHLLKAIAMQRRYGGQIVCLLNAETIRNPYTRQRQTLVRELEELNARTVYVKDAFKHAERKTDVEVVVVYIDIEKPERSSDIYDRMHKAAEEEEQDAECRSLAFGGYIERLLQQYKVEVAAGIELLHQYTAMCPYILDSMDGSYSRPIIELKVDGGGYSSSDINAYLRKVRYKYWNHLFSNTEFLSRLTTNLRDEFYGMVNELKDYEFSAFNIMQIYCKMNAELLVGVKESIFTLFDKLSCEHSCDNAKNVHYYNGWKTNKAKGVGMKAIIPAYGFFSTYSWQSDPFNMQNVYGTLSDIEKILNYLDGNITDEVRLEWVLQRAFDEGRTRNINCKYFSVTFYKKGTCHITFHERRIVDALNLYVGKCRSYIPPYYGKVAYSDLSDDDKTIVDEFQGKDVYENIFSNQAAYMFEAESALPALTA